LILCYCFFKIVKIRGGGGGFGCLLVIYGLDFNYFTSKTI